MKKIDSRPGEGFLPIVSRKLGLIYDYLQTNSVESLTPTLFNLRLATLIDSYGKKHELIYVNQNDIYQVRLFYSPKKDAYYVTKYNKNKKRTIEKQQIKPTLKRPAMRKVMILGRLRSFSVQSGKMYRIKCRKKATKLCGTRKLQYLNAEYWFYRFTQEIANICILRNNLMLPFERLRWAVIVQAFDDYRLANNRIRNANKRLKEDAKKHNLSSSQINLLHRDITEGERMMKTVWRELYEINPQYTLKLRELKKRKYRTVQEMLDEQRRLSNEEG